MIGMSNKKRADCITDYNPTTHKFPAGTMRERHGADPAFAVVREHSERNADGVFAKHYPAPKDRPKTSYNPVSQTLISEKKEQKYWQQKHNKDARQYAKARKLEEQRRHNFDPIKWKYNGVKKTAPEPNERVCEMAPNGRPHTTRPMRVLRPDMTDGAVVDHSLKYGGLKDAVPYVHAPPKTSTAPETENAAKLHHNVQARDCINGQSDKVNIELGYNEFARFHAPVLDRNKNKATNNIVFRSNMTKRSLQWDGPGDKDSLNQLMETHNLSPRVAQPQIPTKVRHGSQRASDLITGATPTFRPPGKKCIAPGVGGGDSAGAAMRWDGRHRPSHRPLDVSRPW